MKRDIPKLFVVVAAFAAAALLPPATAAADGDGPAIHLTPWCTPPAGDPSVKVNYGVKIWVTGLAPYSPYTAELKFSSDPDSTWRFEDFPGTTYPNQADALGNHVVAGGLGEQAPIPLVTVTMWYDGGEYTATMEHPCEGSNVELAEPPWPPYLPGPPPADPSPPDDLGLSAPTAQKTSRKHLAAKRQCRHRGWKHYGFKNRRRCIAFVRHTHRS